MGTNYYVRYGVCKTCGHSSDVYHIGKSSGGWCFSLHVDPDRGINNLDDVVRLFLLNEIVDEYDKSVLGSKMLQIIIKRKGYADFSKPYPTEDYKSWEDFFLKNQAEPGPDGLLRHKVGNGLCIGHGDGPYDYMIGDFS